MPLLSRWKNRLIAWFATRIPAFARRLVAAYRPWESRGEIPWTPARKPLAQCRVAVVTTTGVHHPFQPPFDMQDPEGDPSFRALQADEIDASYQITHDYYDHSDARQDLNIILPLDRLRELVAEGVVGELAATHYSFMGHVDGRHIPTLIAKSAREVAARLKESGVDVVLLTPG